MARTHVEYVPLKYVRGWPTPSTRPYQLFVDGKYRAAFASMRRAKFAASKIDQEVAK